MNPNNADVYLKTTNQAPLALPRDPISLQMPSRRASISFLRAFIALAAAVFVVCLLVSCGNVETNSPGLTGSLNYTHPEAGTEASFDYSNGEGSYLVRHPILDPETGKVIAWAGVSERFGKAQIIPEK